MQALTRFALGHKLLVVAFWLVAAVAGALTVGATTSRLTTSYAMPGAAFTADAKITATYHNGATDPTVAVITLPAGTTLTSPGVTAGLGRAFAAAGQVAPATRVVDYATTGDRSFVTRDGQSTFALVFGPAAGPMGPGADAAVQHAVQTAAPPTWRTSVTGISALVNTKAAPKGNSVLVESVLGGFGALVVLVFVFASFLAVVPLVIAGVSILTTFLAVLALTRLTPVSMIVEFLIALIGLGVAIDYSLLVITRWREERAHGRDNAAAVQAAMASAGRAVVFSGLTVGIGLLALVVLPVPFLRSAGIGGVLIPVISVAVAVTLLPVLLATVGPRLDWPRIRTENTASRAWSAWARFTVRRRGVVALAVGVETIGDGVHSAACLHGGEHRGGERWPHSLPLGVVGRVRAVVQDCCTLGGPGERVRVRGIEREVPDRLQSGVAAGAAGEGDLLAAFDQECGDVAAYGSGADDEVVLRHGGVPP